MMAEQNGHRVGLPQDNPHESAYPPPPGEEDERQRQPYQQLPPVTLPPIQHPNEPYGGGRYPPPPPPDPRVHGNYATSPTGTNGYAAPGAYPPLPPVQPPPDQRYGVEARSYYEARGSSYPAPQPPPPDNFYYPHRPPSGSPYPGYDYGRPQAPQAQAAPRQRTSIACSYCRRRKIRCSGYGTSDGVCSNCRKTGNKCVFQPVSSSSTTAFVPVSAVPGGVPPGTPLYGAFGQPLAQGAPPGAAGPGPGPGPGGPPLPPPPGSAQPYPGPPGQPGQPPEGYTGHSPRAAYYPPPPEDTNGRRRPNEEDHNSRLPPPNVYGEHDPRRRSPASPSQSGTPPQPQYDYPPNAGFESRDRTSTPRRDSPNSPQQGGNGPMSLHAVIDQPPSRPPPTADSGRDIDQNMLGRLNRRT